MFCKYCGSQLTGDENFCSKCGKAVDFVIVQKRLTAVDGHVVEGWTSGTCPKCGQVCHAPSNGFSLNCPKCGQPFSW